MKDEAELGDIEFEEILRLVDLTASEKAIFLELMQRLAAANFENRRTRRTNCNMDNFIDEALAGCTDVIQALLLRASYFEISGEEKNGTASRACQLIVDKRQDEYENLRVELREELQKASSRKLRKNTMRTIGSTSIEKRRTKTGTACFFP